MTDPWARALTRERNGRVWWALWLAFPAAGLATFERLYAYFRWADDVVDAPVRDGTAVRAFVTRQERVIGGLEAPESPGERAIADVLENEGGARLRPVVTGMLAALRFDAERGTEPIPKEVLQRQVERVGDAFVTAIWVCAGEPDPLPEGVAELARASCLVHILRDRELDRTLGYDNRPPGPDGAPVDERTWVAELALDADRRFALGYSALSAPMRWATRGLLRRYANHYRGVLPEAARIRLP